MKATAKIARIGDQEVRPEREFVITDGRNEWLGSEVPRQPFRCGAYHGSKFQPAFFSRSDGFRRSPVSCVDWARCR